MSDEHSEIPGLRMLTISTTAAVIVAPGRGFRGSDDAHGQAGIRASDESSAADGVRALRSPLRRQPQNQKLEKRLRKI